MVKKLKGACIIGQSGGPTAVINASAYGVIKTALESEYITRVLGAQYGILGVLNDRLYDMSEEDSFELSLLTNTPSSELGSSRYKLADPEEDESDYIKILETFKKYDVRYFFFNGGNDSMDTCNKISKYLDKAGYECRVIGVPKTIDNDLALTDHCPGYGSAAKYIATSVCEIYKDSRVYDKGTIVVVEIMGRHAGWLAAASALAGLAGCKPDLIFLPEIPFDMDKFIEDAIRIYNKNRRCIACVSEGLCFADGSFVSNAETSATDGFGHAQLGGLGAILANEMKIRTGAKVRAIELSLLQRVAAHLASETDLNEAFMAGQVAVNAALEGKTGYMVAFERDLNAKDYKCDIAFIPLSEVANKEKKFPLEWIDNNSQIKQEYISYALPLIQGEPERVYENSLPRYARLKKEFV